MATASFVTIDSTTQGTWIGVYGAVGYYLVGGASSLPAGVSVTQSGASTYTWPTSASVIGLEVPPSGSSRLQCAWYANPEVDVSVADGSSYRLAVYCCDFDNHGRAQTVSVVDPSSGTVLDSRSISGFGSGVWLVWDVAGSVTLKFVYTGGNPSYNAVVSGFFFGSTPQTALNFAWAVSTSPGRPSGGFSAGSSPVPAVTSRYGAASIGASAAPHFPWSAGTRLALASLAGSTVAQAVPARSTRASAASASVACVSTFAIFASSSPAAFELAPSAGASISFREALVAKLSSISELTAIVGGAIYPGAVPQSHDLGRDGPALVYSIVSMPRPSALARSDGTASAHVQLSAYAYSLAQSDSIARAIFNAIDGPPVNPWAAGSPFVLSVSHRDEVDLPEPPRAGTDQWIYHIASDYLVRYRAILPTMV